MGQPDWLAVSQVYNASKVAPLAHWPDGYSGWAVEALLALKSEEDRHQARMIKAAQQGPSKGTNPNLPPMSQNKTAPRSSGGKPSKGR